MRNPILLIGKYTFFLNWVDSTILNLHPKIAGTYVKLQEAFYSERNAVGNWTVIGYKAPGDASGKTTNFTYAGTGTFDATEGTATTAVEKAWYANNNVKLNDCTPKTGTDGNWTLTVTPATISANAGASVSLDAAVADANCLQLTPNFKAIGK